MSACEGLRRANHQPGLGTIPPSLRSSVAMVSPSWSRIDALPEKIGVNLVAVNGAHLGILSHSRRIKYMPAYLMSASP